MTFLWIILYLLGQFWQVNYNTGNIANQDFKHFVFSIVTTNKIALILHK